MESRHIWPHQWGATTPRTGYRKERPLDREVADAISLHFATRVVCIVNTMSRIAERTLTDGRCNVSSKPTSLRGRQVLAVLLPPVEGKSEGQRWAVGQATPEVEGVRRSPAEGSGCGVSPRFQGGRPSSVDRQESACCRARQRQETPAILPSMGRAATDAAPRTEKSPIALDIFAGAGGLTLGLKRAGFRVAGAVEIDPLAVDSYSANHPEVLVWEADIRSVDPSDIMMQLDLAPGELALLAGCAPCQGFSRIRTRNSGTSAPDDRNDLVLEFGRLARALQPRAIMMENVPALADDPRLGALYSVLEDLGYPVRAGQRILDAADYRVPQRRRRLVVLAVRHGVVTFAPRVPERATVREALAGMPPAGSSGDPLHDLPETRSDRVMRMIASVPVDGGSRTDLEESLRLQCHSGFDGFKDVYGRMAWDKVAPTITAGCHNPSKGRFLHPDEDRAITLREAALLQSFPRDYFFSLDRGKAGAAALIGNALPPAFVEAHARQVADALARTA